MWKIALILSFCVAAAVARPPSDRSDPTGNGPQIPLQNTDAPEEVVKFEKSTPAQDAAAIADAQQHAADVSSRLNIKFTELQTHHFIIFTDWDPREYGFLKTNVEGAYNAVSHQFDLSSSDNIFIGKLPVFMFTKQDDFLRFAHKIDEFNASKMVAGYYTNANDFNHMAMWKPDVSAAHGNVLAAERMWAYVLTHEFTHAFIARYRTNRPIPRWLNEGIAEVIANGQFPNPDALRFAKLMAKSSEVKDIFDDKKMPPGEMYPVMMTMTQALIKNDRKLFIDYFNSIKDGADPVQALQDHYHVDYAGLQSAWQKYIKTAK